MGLEQPDQGTNVPACMHSELGTLAQCTLGYTVALSGWRPPAICPPCSSPVTPKLSLCL